MNSSRRLAIFILLAAIFLFAGVLFWPFILNEIIRPIALVVWLFLRIFVLSIGQGVYWIAIILVTLIFLARLLSRSQTSLPIDESLDSNETINTIRYWRIQFSLNDSSPRDVKIIRRELAYLLASLYASKQRTTTNYGIYDALQRGQIPLPERLHTFLFPEEPQESGRSIKKLFQSIRQIPRKLIRKWTGQETAEQYRMIEEVLGYMEKSLEVKNDEREFTPNKF
jgi:hypothetical protein